MNSLFDEDNHEEPKSDADLTLGIGSLLSIFFGIVLICGIFFGFGYSMGRRNGRAAATPTTLLPPQTAANTSPLPENALSGAPLKPQQPDNSSAFPPSFTNPTPDENKAQANAHAPAANPPAPDETAHRSADQGSTREGSSREGSAKPPPPPKTARVVEPTTPDPSLNAVPFAHRAPLPSKPHAGINAPLAQAPGDSPIIPGQPIMVQIAAVSRQEDAEVLAGALRKRGFNPTVRPGTGDKFFHVQVGPFTDKNQAETMKQQLLADGYNAIVK
ncbi:MAG TPA: SPOR domain-containing protein [Acidobacteriaceae bacterium]|jgi:cell division septation protein DedD